MGLRPTNSDENRSKALGGGLEPARGFIPAGGLSDRLLVFNRLQWVFDRAAGVHARLFPCAKIVRDGRAPSKNPA
jgi:hypothetical protein